MRHVIWDPPELHIVEAPSMIEAVERWLGEQRDLTITTDVGHDLMMWTVEGTSAQIITARDDDELHRIVGHLLEMPAYKVPWYLKPVDRYSADD